MTGRPAKSRRGVYYDLEKSPYEYTNSYGDIFKFSSEKKMEIYTRDVPKEIERVTKLLSRHDLYGRVPMEIQHFLYRQMYAAFYRKIEG